MLRTKCSIFTVSTPTLQQQNVSLASHQKLLQQSKLPFWISNGEANFCILRIVRANDLHLKSTVAFPLTRAVIRSFAALNLGTNLSSFIINFLFCWRFQNKLVSSALKICFILVCNLPLQFLVLEPQGKLLFTSSALANMPLSFKLCKFCRFLNFSN